MNALRKTNQPLNIKLVVGLGNPGHEHENTFHNAGRMFVFSVAGGGKFESEKEFDYLKLDETYLVLTLSPMNQSGPAVKAALKKFKAKPEELLVAQDDSDLILGNYKTSFGRNSAGHKGVESIMNSLGTKNFYRLRFGIRGKQGERAGEFVLRQINKKDLEKLNSAFYGAKVKVMEKLKPLGLG